MTSPGLEGKFDEHSALHMLLQVPTIKEMYGRISGPEFYHIAIGVLNGLIEIAKSRGIEPIVQDHSKRLVIAQSLLEKELRRTPIPSHPTDAEPRMEHRDGQSYIVVGDGPDNGGYSVELRENGENRVHYR